jgi:hypothetical protein
MLTGGTEVVICTTEFSTLLNISLSERNVLVSEPGVDCSTCFSCAKPSEPKIVYENDEIMIKIKNATRTVNSFICVAKSSMTYSAFHIK